MDFIKKSMWRFWAKHSWGFDLGMTLLLSVASFFVTFYYQGAISPALKSTLYSGIMQVCAALLGFILTATSILVVFHDRARQADEKSRMGMISRTNGYDELFFTFSRSCWLLLIGAVLSLFALLLDQQASHTAPNSIKSSCGIFLAASSMAIAILRTARCIYTMQEMIRMMLNDDRDKAKAKAKKKR